MNATFTPLTFMISGVLRARAEGKLPGCLTPARERAFPGWLTPYWPWSSEWFDAVSQASQPVQRIDRARAGGVLKTGYPCGGRGDIGVSMWQIARSALLTIGRMRRSIGRKS